MGGPDERGPSERASSTEAALSGGPAIAIAAAERGAGKSTAFAIAAAQAAALGWEPGGICCPGVYREGQKAAVLCRALLPNGSAGEPWELARAMPGYESVGFSGAGSPGRGPPRGPSPVALGGRTFSYGKWLFALEGLARADAACAAALADPRPRTVGAESAVDIAAAKRRVVFVDEIGPLELSFGLGLVGTLAAVDRLAAVPRTRDAGRADVKTGGEGTPAAIVVAVRPELAEELAGRWPGSRIIRASGAAMRSDVLADGIIAALRSALGPAALIAD